MVDVNLAKGLSLRPLTYLPWCDFLTKHHLCVTCHIAGLRVQILAVREAIEQGAARPAYPEPKARDKELHDMFLDEMAWMAKEFARERKWKLMQVRPSYLCCDDAGHAAWKPPCYCSVSLQSNAFASLCSNSRSSVSQIALIRMYSIDVTYA